MISNFQFHENWRQFFLVWNGPPFGFFKKTEGNFQSELRDSRVTGHTSRHQGIIYVSKNSIFDRANGKPKHCAPSSKIRAYLPSRRPNIRLEIFFSAFNSFFMRPLIFRLTFFQKNPGELRKNLDFRIKFHDNIVKIFRLTEISIELAQLI